MNVLPLRWQGASRAGALRALLDARVAEWASQWMTASRASGVVVDALADSRPDPAGGEGRWHVLRDGDALLSMRLSPRAFEYLGCLLAGTTTADDAGLSAGLGQRALTGLMRSLFGAQAPASLIAIDGVPAPADIGSRFGALGMQVSIGTIRIEFYANAALCARLVPLAQVAREPLVHRRAAIGPVDATLDAVLDLGQAVLADTLSLKPGEVLKTAIPVSAGLRLVSSRGEDILGGTLVADGAHRALKVTQLHFKKETSR